VTSGEGPKKGPSPQGAASLEKKRDPRGPERWFYWGREGLEFRERGSICTLKLPKKIIDRGSRDKGGKTFRPCRKKEKIS